MQRASLDRIARFHLWGIHRHGGEVGWYDRRVGLRVMKRRGRGRGTLGGGKTELLLNLLDQGTLWVCMGEPLVSSEICHL